MHSHYILNKKIQRDVFFCDRYRVHTHLKYSTKSNKTQNCDRYRIFTCNRCNIKSNSNHQIVKSTWCTFVLGVTDILARLCIIVRYLFLVHIKYYITSCCTHCVLFYKGTWWELRQSFVSKALLIFNLFQGLNMGDEGEERILKRNCDDACLHS
jgi:hypothetical protein